MILGIAILLVFILFAGLMYLNKLPALLALPAMAVLVALAARLPLKEILTFVIAEGAARLHLPMITILVGAMLGQFINRSGIAETLIKKAAELSGDQPFAVALALTLVSALLFTVLGGLGAVIMVATVVLPILLSLGLSPLLAGGLFLLGVSFGGIFNLTNWQLYISILNLNPSAILNFALPLGAAMLAVLLAFLIIGLRREGISAACSVYLDEEKPKSVSLYALLTPLIPLILVFGFALYNLRTKPAHPFEFPIITAMLIGLIYGWLTTFEDWQNSVNLLTRSIFEGINSAAPAVALIMGIGMLLNAVMHPNVADAISPLLLKIMPSTALGYIIFFTVLAPLSLYRGPLNIWGLGSGLIGLLLAAKALPAAAIMAALLSVGQIQGVCDPTNTHNIWVANFLHINVQDILRRTIGYMWILAAVGLVIAGVRYF